MRIGLYLSSVATTRYASTVQTYISDGEVAIPTMFYVPGTRNVLSGDQSAADLAATVQNWVTNFRYYAPNAFALQLHALSASTGMVFVFGEFGPGHDVGPSPTLLTPQQVIGAAEAAGIGWMGWAWDDNNLANGASNNNGFSMTLDGPGMYTVPADLTTYGKEMVTSNYALARAAKATDF